VVMESSDFSCFFFVHKKKRISFPSGNELVSVSVIR